MQSLREQIGFPLKIEAIYISSVKIEKKSVTIQQHPIYPGSGHFAYECIANSPRLWLYGALLNSYSPRFYEYFASR